jgi:hypothetical protein
MREAMMADVVEGLVFPIIGKAADGIESRLTNGQGINGAAATIAGRLNAGFDPVTGAPFPKTGPNPNAVPHPSQPAQSGNIWPPIPEVLPTPEELEYLDQLFEEYP